MFFQVQRRATVVLLIQQCAQLTQEEQASRKEDVGRNRRHSLSAQRERRAPFPSNAGASQWRMPEGRVGVRWGLSD